MALGLSKLLAPLTRTQKGAVTPDLLNAHGFVHQVSAGVYDLLPLGLRVQHKIERIVRTRLQEAGCVELALATLVAPSLWKQSGRLVGSDPSKWPHEYLFSDGHGHLLAPTGEEQITSLVGSVSYRQLPLQPFQITRKFRNELRPRGGLLRTREFTMKDLYTFDVTAADAMATYGRISDAYARIFSDIGVPFVRADADSGAMGGDLSHEYQFLSDEGEDIVVQCPSCGYAANTERAESHGVPEEPKTKADAAVESIVHVDEGAKGIRVVHSKGRHPSAVLVKRHHSVESAQTLVDSRVEGGTVALVEPEAGETCVKCGTPGLELRTGIEVGHTFYLGSRYSSPLKALVTHQNGSVHPIQMGCYGIGVTRIVAAAASALRDAHGLRWPATIAPYDCIVLSKDPALSHDIASSLCRSGVDAIYEDRTPQIGHAMRAAREAGWPVVVIAGNKYAAEGLVEVQSRLTNVSEYVALNRVPEVINHFLKP